jgi:hypothetical protein
MAVEFLEKSLEALIVAAIAAAESSDIQVLGWWQPVATGVVKNQAASSILVTVLPRSNESFGSKIVSLSGRIDIISNGADDPTGANMPEYSGPVFNLLEAWNADQQAMETALAVSGKFSPGGFMFSGGGDADYDDQQGCWFSTVTFQIKGVII